MSVDFEQPPSPTSNFGSKQQDPTYSPVMTLPENYSLFRAPASSFSSSTTSGASFSSVDEGDALAALPAISRDFAVPARNDESRRPKTAGGLMQRGGWGGTSAFSTIEETGPLPIFGDPFESQQQQALNLVNKADSISPDSLVDPNASGRRASEPRFNFGQGLVSLPSHVQFLQNNNLASANWASPAQPSLNSLSLANGDGYNPHSYSAQPRAMSTADLRPQTSDGIPSYLSNAKIPPPPTFHLAGPDSRRPHPPVGINGLPHTYHPPRSFSTNYQHPPPYPIAGSSAPQRAVSLDHSRFGVPSSSTPAQAQAQATGKGLPKKRPRRRFDEIERLYTCGFDGCEKAYGTLNHLNAHVTMQKHGEKRLPGEFKELRKAWRKKKREMAADCSGSQARGSDEFESSDDVISRRESDVSTNQDQLHYFRAYAPPSTAWPGSSARPYDESSRPTSSSSVASSASGFGGYYTQPPSYLPHPHPQRRPFAPSHVPIPAPPQSFQPPSSDFATPTQQHPNRGAGAGSAYPFQTLSMPLPPAQGGAYAMVAGQSQFAFGS